MNENHPTDALFLLDFKHDLRKKIGADDLVEQFEEGQLCLQKAVDQYQRQFLHLFRNLREAFNSRETNPAILTRRFAGIRHRLEALDGAVLSIRGAYAEIWEALESALGEAPLRAVSERARKGYVGKITKNAKARAKAEAMAAIRHEWDLMESGATKHMSDAAFARLMHARFGDVINNEGSIKNRISKWRKEDN